MLLHSYDTTDGDSSNKINYKQNSKLFLSHFSQKKQDYINKDSRFQRIYKCQQRFRLMLNNKYRNLLLCLLIILITAILRIPKQILPGIDAFKLIWDSQLILEGNFHPWLIHPLSIFGAFPYSGYPLGSVLIFSLFMVITKSNIIASTYIFTSFFTIISIITFYTLSLEIFNNVFFETTAIYSEYSLNASPRLIFMAIFPLILFFNLRYLKTCKKKFLALSFSLITILLLFHRMSMVLYIFSIITSLLPSIRRYLKYQSFKPRIAKWIRFAKKNFFALLGICNSIILFFTLIFLHNQTWWVNKNPNFLTTNVGFIDTGIKKVF